jgi:Leu/Phe-tRNA-protein transferase
MLHRTPPALLEQILSSYFPMISGAEELDRVVTLLEQWDSEFCGCVTFDTRMVAQTCKRGFLPMSESFTGHDILLIKSHRRRSVHHLSPLHVSQSDLRRSRGTTLRFSHNFERCLRETVVTHRERWLTDALCASLTQLAGEPHDGVRALSVELYRDESLIAGEIGYQVGAAYTSLSGFYRESGAGKTQLLALGPALRRAGFALWDLGMPMEYKRSLGAELIGREPFLELYRSHATGTTRTLETVESCRDLLFAERKAAQHHSE